MSAAPLALQQATILQHCKVLHLPTVAGQCGPLAAQAVRERHAIARRIKDAHLPRVKTLDEFDFSQAPKISATQLRELARLRDWQGPSPDRPLRGRLSATATGPAPPPRAH